MNFQKVNQFVIRDGDYEVRAMRMTDKPNGKPLWMFSAWYKWRMIPSGYTKNEAIGACLSHEVANRD